MGRKETGPKGSEHRDRVIEREGGARGSAHWEQLTVRRELRRRTRACRTPGAAPLIRLLSPNWEPGRTSQGDRRIESPPTSEKVFFFTRYLAQWSELFITADHLIYVCDIIDIPLHVCRPLHSGNEMCGLDWESGGSLQVNTKPGNRGSSFDSPQNIFV